MQTIGQLNMPIGLMFDTQKFPNMAAWNLNVDPALRINGAAIVNVWMTQGWFNNMFFITGKTVINETAAVLDMIGDGGYPSGGWQGGRHWQTQCSFDGCGPGGPLLGGGWYVSNVAAELDSFDEYFFDPATQSLTLFYNSSDTMSGNPLNAPAADLVLMASQLEVFFNISGTADVTIDGLGFRDQRFSYLDPWVVAGGGDWGLRPAGAVNLENTDRCTLSNALFSRTDANAVFLGGRNRNASVLDSEFVWLGMNAVASLGLTDQDDATGGEQPWGTLLSGLVAREIALYEKQSSAFFLGRTALSRVEASLFYNGPRAMINVNDHMGGANNFTTSVLFNACRESGDHGPMNSWDRMPFLTSIGTDGGAASYTPALSETTGMFIIGNYGSAQGYDNDDGSNHDLTHGNYFYSCDGFKMDYGGSDSIFHGNVVVVRPYDGQNCQNMWAFVPGHQDILYNNTCVIWQPGVTGDSKSADMVLTQNDCGACGADRSATPFFHDNKYYTTHGNASVNCGGDFGTTIADMQMRFSDFEARSEWHALPTADEVIQFGRDVLGM